jgi:ketosteroid isomerase-like protein
VSRDNLETCRAAVDAVARMDTEALVALTDPEVEWHSFLAETAGVYVGHAGIRQYVQDLRDAWDVFELNVVDSLAVGDVVVLVSTLNFTGKGSGVVDSRDTGHVARLRDGRIVFLRALRDPEEALGAIGEV